MNTLKYSKEYLRLVTFTLLLILVSSCDKFDYSPYEIRLPADMRDLNRKNIDRILALPLTEEDTIKFVITSDTQGFYAHNDALVAHINGGEGIDFVLHNGDITDFGLLQEHKWIHDSFKNLIAPYVTVVGNHDATGNGKDLYKAMYGAFDFSFVVANHKFIFLNTNHWEFAGKVPDLEWLENELIGSEQYQQVFVLSHIPPNNPAFGEDKIAPYKELLSKYGVALSIHGHGNGFSYTKENEKDVYELQVGSTETREYILMKVYKDSYDFSRIAF